MDDYDRGYRTDFRSYSGAAEVANGKSYSASYYPASSNTTTTVVPYSNGGAHPWMPDPPPLPPPPARRAKAASGAGSSGWGLNDAEMKRKRRVASYKAYTVEGKVKSSIRKGFRWIKLKCSELVHGW